MTLPTYISQGLEGGRLRDLMRLTEPDFDIATIAARLAKINRFCGASHHPISVATHSVVVSLLAPHGLQMTALLHDITESFGIGDLISPVKHLLPQYQELEAHILGQLCAPFPALRDSDLIAAYDKRATALEALSIRGDWPEWAVTGGYAFPLTTFERWLTDTYYVREISWSDSEMLFRGRYAALVHP